MALTDSRLEFQGDVLDTSSVIRAMSQGAKRIVIRSTTIVQPPAQNMARQRGIVIEVRDSANGSNGATNGANGRANGNTSNGHAVPPKNGLGASDVDPATGLPWGVRANQRGGPILPTPAPERKPAGYASAPFRTPSSGQGPYQPKLRPGGASVPPSTEPFSGPSAGPLNMRGPAPSAPQMPSVIERGPQGGGGEWGPPLTSDQPNPAAYRAPQSTPSVIERGPRGGGEWGPPLTSDQSNPAAYRPANGSPAMPASLPPIGNGGAVLPATNGMPATLPPIPVPANAPTGGRDDAMTVVPLVPQVVPPAPAPAPKRQEDPNAPLDPITIDLIENSLRSTRFEMDAVLFRTAMSPAIREQHDEFPLIATPDGKMVVGQFGSFINGFLKLYKGTINEGDVFFLNDPYACDGAVSHLNDWLVLLPIFYDGQLVGWSSMFGHMSDIGGAVPGSMPIGARTIHEEGVIIKPFKLFDAGKLDESTLTFVLTQCRLPDWNRSDLFGIVSACRTAEKRVRELCDRFGPKTYLRVLDALLDRNYRAMKELIRQNIPETPQSFEDYVDDDGQGYGPYKLKCTAWREGDKAIFDWEGTDPQSPAAISFLFNESMHKMFVGIYMIMLYDPQILFNDGFFDLLEVRIPKGSLLKPTYPTALNGRTHTLGRVFDVFGAALGKHTPQFLTAAGFSTSPHLFYSGYDQKGEWFQLFQIGFGGVPGRPVGDGMDGHSLWPEFNNIPNEYLESYFPLVIERYEAIMDSGGAGLHRGGNGIDQVYRFLADGEISNHDDRWLTYPWGVIGGKPGERGRKILVKPDGRQIPLPAKADHIRVEAGDVLHYITWGGGGWGDPLERDPETVRLDVLRGFVSEEKARDEYGVVVYDNAEKVDVEATEAVRDDIRATRGPLKDFDFGRSIEDILATCEEETGLKPPQKPVFRAVAG